jgi:hypothetical protein
MARSYVGVQITAGLGNQLFQFATGLASARAVNRRLILVPDFEHTGREFLVGGLADRVGATVAKERPIRRKAISLQGLALPRATRIADQGNPSSHAELLDLVRAKPRALLTGYWQSEEYFETAEPDVRDLILAELAPHRLPVGEIDLSIHIRGGDRLTHPYIRRKFGTLEVDYYRRALDAVRSRVPGETDRVMVFAEDGGEDPVARTLLETLGDGAELAPEGSAMEHLATMATARAHICAGSTFSWWSAWLSGSPAIAFPDPPYRDPRTARPDVPGHWLRVPSVWTEPPDHPHDSSPSIHS